MKATKRRKRNGRIPEYNPDPHDSKVLDAHMDELVKKHPRGWAVVCGGEIFAGRKLQPLSRRAERKYPDKTLLISRIPSERDHFCVL